MSNPRAACGLSEGFVMSSLGCRSSISTNEQPVLTLKISNLHFCCRWS